MDTSLRDQLVGRLVDDRYEVESLIARGGMATVYLARDRRLDREVALKVMHEHLADDPEFVSRFIREARSAARLSHPNVVQVFDQGSDEGLARQALPGGDTTIDLDAVGPPLLYLTMEYLPGRTLREVLAERGALSPRQALSVFEPVLDALGAAHRAGIVHRDVKPENVILTDDGRVKVADFGLARAGTAQTPIGGGARVLGTVAYLAPEMVSRGIADARADVYAAGIMLFEMLTGQQPFVSADPVEVAYRHVHEDVPPPSVVFPLLPAELDNLITTATARDPDDRPPSADRLLAITRGVHRMLPQEVLDLRPPGATGQPVTNAPTQVVGHVRHQHTRALVLSGDDGQAPLVPRLRVHDEDEAVDDGSWAAERRRRGLIALLSVFAVSFALVLGGWWYVAGPGAYTPVPNEKGQQLDVAKRDLTSRGLQWTVRHDNSDTVASGMVVTTQPGPGDSVRKGGTVTLVVSSGPKLVPVPDVAGLSRDDAVAALDAKGLNVSDQDTQAYSDSIDQGSVVGTTPVKDQLVRPGSEVGLVISKGPEPKIQLGKLIGFSREQAVEYLTGQGLKYEISEIDPGTAPPDTVTQQNPAPGTMVAGGQTIQLTITRGNVNGTPVGQPAGVPDVTNQTAQQATQTLQAYGFRVRVIGFFGTVRSQTPGPNSQAPVGSTVTIFVL